MIAKLGRPLVVAELGSPFVVAELGCPLVVAEFGCSDLNVRKDTVPLHDDVGGKLGKRDGNWSSVSAESHGERQQGEDGSFEHVVGGRDCVAE